MHTASKHIRFAFVFLLAFAVVATGSLVAPPTASAASNLCGSGYRKVRDGNVPVVTQNGTRHGVIKVYYSRSEKRNCAVLFKEGSNYGKAQPTNLYIAIGDEFASAPESHDFGNYKYYAGPVYTPRGRSTAGTEVTVSGNFPVKFQEYAQAHKKGWGG